jgi:hypothetical protein
MKKSVKLPFSNELKGGSKSSFKILNNEQINKKIKTNIGLLNYIQKIISYNSNNSNNSNKIEYVKASTTNKYYKNISK